MFQNYIKIAIRNLVKHKGYSFINVVGLAIGISAFILILLFVQDELSYDRYHDNSDRIYRIVELIEGAEESSSAPFPTGQTLVADFPHLVEKSVRFFNMQAPTLALSYEPPSGDIIRFNESRFFFADSSVFDVFDFDVVAGNANQFLSLPNTIIVTRSTARRYFGDDDPIGKTLRFDNQQTVDFEVVGIIEDVRSNSHFQFDMLASMMTLNQFSPTGEFQGNNWFWNPCWTYILLPENGSLEALTEQFPAFVDKYFPPFIKADVKLWLQPLTDIHLTSRLDFEIGPNSDIAYVYIFSAVALFILLIACINFMNLATARSTQRAREVGMRKALGAERNQLIKQFLGESVLLSLLALLAAIPLIYTALPALNSFAAKTLVFDPFSNGLLVVTLIGVILVVGLLSGLYPAFYLSAFQPSRVLKGMMSTGRTSVATLLRKGLVTTQFGISILLIIGTVVAYSQLNFLRNKNLGFEKEQVLMVPISLTPIHPRFIAFKNQALQYSRILNVTVLEDIPGSKYQTQNYQLEGKDQPQQFPRLTVHDDFLETLGMELAAGRAYSNDFPADSASSIMVNEAFVLSEGWGSPEEALGKRISIFQQDREIVGVLKDFHYASLHQQIAPFVIERYNGFGQFSFFGRYMAVRISEGDASDVILYLNDLWDQYIPSKPFEYFFLDDELDRLYVAEETLGRVATTFSVLAIFVACLGLFGMASFSTEQRTKEIGIRKVMGASASGIVTLLSLESVKLVGIAFIIACPIAWLAVSKWLQSFMFHIDVGVFPFILAGGMVLILAWATVSLQSLRAAYANPAQSLQSE